MAATASRFQAKETTVFRDLQNSMRKLGASSLRVTPQPAHDLLDPKAKPDVRAEIVFDRAGKRYVVRCSKWPRYSDNLRAAERTIYYLYRAISEYGAETNEGLLSKAVDQMLSGFEALPDDTVLMLSSGKVEWWEVLGVKPTATKTDIISAYRALARTHHPDTGGSAEEFRKLRAAYEEGMAARNGSA